MKALDLVVRRARVATAADVFDADIGIADGRIVALGQGLPAGAREIDAAGRVVTPGGVDAHCHLDQPMAPPVRMADDFDTGTRAAACGGTTTVIPFAAQVKGHSLRAAVADYHRRAEGKAHVDYAFHLIVSDPTPQVLHEELPALIREGYTSFKIYMTYDDLKLDDGQILDVLAVARAHGAMAMIHAENADCIEWLTKRLEAAGRTAPRFHAHVAPHAGGARGHAPRHRAGRAGGRADPHRARLGPRGRGTDPLGARARPGGLRRDLPAVPVPHRRRPGHRRQLPGRALRVQPAAARQVQSRGDLERAGRRPVHGVQQRPRAVQLRRARRQEAGLAGVPFRHIPNGLAGIETRLALLYSEGVLGGRLTLEKFVELTATNPAKAYGLHPRKGTIAIGSDADLVVWDEREFVLTNALLHHAVDHTPYEGHALRAWPALTLAGGDVVWDGTAFHPRHGRGPFPAVRRARRCGRESHDAPLAHQPQHQRQRERADPCRGRTQCRARHAHHGADGALRRGPTSRRASKR